MPLEPKYLEGLLVPQQRALIFLTGSGKKPKLDPDAVATTLGLTPRQAALAVMLARGSSLARAGTALGITLETARWHLKEIFERTETHRQIDLVRLLLQSFGIESQI